MSEYWKHDAKRAKKHTGQDWTHAQEKLDGWRCTFFIQGDANIVAFGKRMEPHLEFFERFPSLRDHPVVQRLVELDLPGCTSIDCEIVTTGEADRASTVSALQGPASGYNIIPFAMPYYDGNAYFDEPILATLSDFEKMGLPFATTWTKSNLLGQLNHLGLDLHEDIGEIAKQLKIEGFMLKYGGQYDKWYKVKPEPTVDCIITDVTSGKGKFEGLIGSIVCSVLGQKMGVGHQLIEIANASGMTDAEREHLTELHRQGKLMNKVVELKYQLLGKKGRLTHPRYVRLRPDKPRAECTWSQLEDNC